MDLSRMSVRRAGFVDVLMNPNPCLFLWLSVLGGGDCRSQVPVLPRHAAILLHSLLYRLPVLLLHLLAAPWWDRSLGGWHVRKSARLGHPKNGGPAPSICFYFGGKKPRSCPFS